MFERNFSLKDQFTDENTIHTNNMNSQSFNEDWVQSGATELLTP